MKKFIVILIVVLLMEVSFFAEGIVNQITKRCLCDCDDKAKESYISLLQN